MKAITAAIVFFLLVILPVALLGLLCIEIWPSHDVSHAFKIGILVVAGFGCLLSVVVGKKGATDFASLIADDYWRWLHIWNVICLRRWVIIAIFLGTVIVTLLCTYFTYPIYSATCIIKDFSEDYFGRPFGY